MSKYKQKIDILQNLNNQVTESESYNQKVTSNQTNTYSLQQQQLLNKCKINRKKLIRRLMYFVIFFNFFTQLCLTFSMLFYRWIYITLDTNITPQKQQQHYWVNQLYMTNDNNESLSYQSFNEVKTKICSSNIYCQGVIQGFKFSGYLSFSFFSFAALVQIFDFIKLVYSICYQGNVFQQRGHFRHAIFIGAYSIALSLSVFSAYVIKVTHHFGLSFWICLGALVLWPSILVYGQYKVNKIQKQALIQNLLQQQKQLRNDQILENQFKSDQLSQSEQKITL